jgi:ubiquitin-protein ligase
MTNPQGRDDRLREDLERMQRLRQLNPGKLDFQVDNLALPQDYRVTLRCKGVFLDCGEPCEIEEHQVRILLGPTYPREPPRLVWQTPIFHPNIRAWEVCLLGHWGAQTRLYEVIIWLWDMVRYHLKNLDSPLDEAAKRWAEGHEAEFPYDTYDLRAALTVTPAAPPATPQDVNDLIRILPE